MNLYTAIGSVVGTDEAASLSQRLAAWHDSMVIHERRVRAGRPGHGCDDDCAHVKARALWAEVMITFGERAHELSFLRSRAMSAMPPPKDDAVETSAGRCPVDDRRSKHPGRQTGGGRRQVSFLSESAAKEVAIQEGAEPETYFIDS
jgi:hypothetical protein